MPSFSTTLKQQLQRGRQNIISTFLQNGKTDTLLDALKSEVDGALTIIWEKCALAPDATLVAVGGYGRGELFPASDVDVLILLPKQPDCRLQNKLEKLVQLFWDLGLEIGHSIRTVEECLFEAEKDITVQTSLLEARPVCGNADLFLELKQCCVRAMNAHVFFRTKILELRQRHHKYDNTPYSLEPNCKESPGGLRDLHIILWVAKAARLGNTWHQLARQGLLTPAEARQLAQNERILKSIRIHLHIVTGRQEDRLVFDVQTAVARSMGLSGGHTHRASEYLMQRYYRAAKAVTQLNVILLQNMEAHLFPETTQPIVINPRFCEINGLLDIARSDTFDTTPSAMLEVFLLLSEHSRFKDMSTRTLRALWHARFKINQSFRRDPANRALFLQILQAPLGAAYALYRMNETSILGRYLPNFHAIVGQMQHNLFHIYTVDQHTMMVMRNIQRFFQSEHAHEHPLCSQLAADLNQPWRLLVAALFHDIAKGRGGDHAQLGMQDTRDFCMAHGLSEADTALIVFLVEHHLTLSQVAQKQDLSDPEVIANFARLVSDEERLVALYLLTVADICGTNPKIWNAWKGKLLTDLYHMTKRALAGNTPSMESEQKKRQEDALVLLRACGVSQSAHEALWNQLDVVYFLRHDASEIAWQTQAIHPHINSTTPIVTCRLSPINAGLEITLYTQDQTDLFARICACLDSHHFSILDAKIHTTRHGYALDTFLVTAPCLDEKHSNVQNRIQHALVAALCTHTVLPAACPSPLLRQSHQSRHFPATPIVHLRPDGRGQQYLLSITTHDRSGLLYTIACVLARHKINLHTAKIMTLGERVEDVFLIDGIALNNPRNQIQLESDLLCVLQPNLTLPAQSECP